jgi:hypothetical protein
VVTGWYGQTLTLVPDLDDGLSSQEDRLEEMAAAHPEVDWLPRHGGVYSAYVHLEDGGYQAGGYTLRELLDKLEDFFDPTESDRPDTG